MMMAPRAWELAGTVPRGRGRGRPTKVTWQQRACLLSPQKAKSVTGEAGPRVQSHRLWKLLLLITPKVLTCSL